MATKAKRLRAADREITTTVVRSLEPIDLTQWLDRYARAILDAEAPHPAASAPLEILR